MPQGAVGINDGIRRGTCAVRYARRQARLNHAAYPWRCHAGDPASNRPAGEARPGAAAGRARACER
jgi:hypothetical protein